jgi:hypothetical protein
VGPAEGSSRGSDEALQKMGHFEVYKEREEVAREISTFATDLHHFLKAFKIITASPPVSPTPNHYQNVFPVSILLLHYKLVPLTLSAVPPTLLCMLNNFIN